MKNGYEPWLHSAWDDGYDSGFADGFRKGVTTKIIATMVTAAADAHPAGEPTIQ